MLTRHIIDGFSEPSYGEVEPYCNDFPYCTVIFELMSKRILVWNVSRRVGHVRDLCIDVFVQEIVSFVFPGNVTFELVFHFSSYD